MDPQTNKLQLLYCGINYVVRTLRIEFPSASPADVTGPRAPDLCGAARALLGDCSPLKTLTRADARASWDLVANCMSIINFFYSSVCFRVHHIHKSYLHVY